MAGRLTNSQTPAGGLNNPQNPDHGGQIKLEELLQVNESAFVAPSIEDVRKLRGKLQNLNDEEKTLQRLIDEMRDNLVTLSRG
jgi:hypothetical protein